MTERSLCRIRTRYRIGDVFPVQPLGQPKSSISAFKYSRRSLQFAEHHASGTSDILSRPLLFRAQISYRCFALQSYIRRCSIVEAQVVVSTATLNVSVLCTFTPQCTTGCQQAQVNRLSNTSSNAQQSIVITYDGKPHSHTVALTSTIR